MTNIFIYSSCWQLRLNQRLPRESTDGKVLNKVSIPFVSSETNQGSYAGEGELAINVGTAEKPNFYEVDFETLESDKGVYYFIDMTSSIVSRSGVSNGSSYVRRVTVCDLYSAPDKNGNLIFYKTLQDKFTLTVTKDIQTE